MGIRSRAISWRDELNKARLELEAKKITGRINHEDADVVKTYAGDLKGLPAESNIAETKTYLRFFVKRIEIDRNQAVIK